MRSYLLMTFAIMSVVSARSDTSFLRTTEGVDFEHVNSASSFVLEDSISSFLPSNSQAHMSEEMFQAPSQGGEEYAASNQAVVARDSVAGLAPVIDEATTESWWSYGKRMAAGTLDVAYQYLRSNRWMGVESGSAQSWSTLTQLDTLKTNWKVNSKQQLLIANNNQSVISMQVCDDVISDGYERLGLKGALAKASKIQKQSNVKKVYLPLNLNLTNYVFGEHIMHRVTLETIYDDSGSLSSVRILDSQMGLSGDYLSNASMLCKEAFEELKLKDSNVSAEYTPVGIQLPGTGNCQKMAAYMAVALGEGKAVEDLSLNKANSFCTEMHQAAEASSKPKSKSWFGGWMQRLR